MDLDVPLASFEDLFDSSDSSGSNAGESSSSDTAQSALISEEMNVENPRPKPFPKWALTLGIILFFCLIALLYWYLLFYRKKKKYADVEVITFADDGDAEDDFDTDTYRK